ncbi:MAG: polyisoprenoid-binding protein YceI [Planctomycetota bacterium]|jgi:polyisoprenoid-binding protein YceI
MKIQRFDRVLIVVLIMLIGTLFVVKIDSSGRSGAEVLVIPGEFSDSRAIDVGVFTTELAPGAYILRGPTSRVSWKIERFGGSEFGEMEHKRSVMRIGADGTISEGSLLLHVADIRIDSRGNELQAKQLKTHLLGEDFFSGSHYPRIEFVIESAREKKDGNHVIAGDLAMRGQTHSVSIPVEMKQHNQELHIDGYVLLERSQWGLDFRSKKLGTVKDQVISDDIKITVHLEYFLQPSEAGE